MLKMREPLSASIVTWLFSAVASIVSASVISSSNPPRVIVWPESDAAKLIVSAPMLPAGASPTVTLVLAAWMASRSVTVPSRARLSAVESTVITANMRRSSSASTWRHRARHPPRGPDDLVRRCLDANQRKRSWRDMPNPPGESVKSMDRSYRSNGVAASVWPEFSGEIINLSRAADEDFRQALVRVLRTCYNCPDECHQQARHYRSTTVESSLSRLAWGLVEECKTRTMDQFARSSTNLCFSRSGRQALGLWCAWRKTTDCWC